MTILEQLATTDEAYIADMIEARRKSAPEREGPDGTLVGWNNKSSWDNWAQKPKPFKKKTVYFRKKN
ncbi:hypothetical protein OG394_14060 [Kribbella sp. NBC_01245]|uniref:hypothetical protein n=1 Tax=Kribbella sp. NBC_01245 TaxID=2903578 RepID=UPI002E2E5900|nr:hypothetical protein [Kribbella sp. NBC_01245]